MPLMSLPPLKSPFIFHMPLMPFITLPSPHKTWINYAIIPAISKEIIEQGTHNAKHTQRTFQKSYEFPPEKLLFILF